MSLVRKSVVASGSLAAAILVAGTCLAAEFKFNLANEYNATSLPAQTEAFFVDLVSKKSNGRIEITPHFGGALGYKSRDHWTAVRDGAVAIASTPIDKLVGFDPIFPIQTMPFVSPTIPETKALYEVCVPYYEKALAKVNQTLLFGSPWTPQGIWAKKKITSIDDLKGLKVRSYDVIGLKTLAAAGLSPIQLSWADVIPALSTGSIVGVLTSDEGGVNAKFWELGVKYFNFLGYGMGISITTMNKAAYDSLPADMQKVLREAAAEAQKNGWKVSEGRVDHNRKAMAAAGAFFVDDVPREVIEHLMNAGAPLLEEWKKTMGPDADKILDEYNKRMGR